MTIKHIMEAGMKYFALGCVVGIVILVVISMPLMQENHNKCKDRGGIMVKQICFNKSAILDLEKE